MSGGTLLVDAWYRRAWWLWLLRPLELLFRCLVVVRRAAYRVGLLASYTPEKPLVVVGNITVGGTGKTPVVVAMIEYLQSVGLRPGVVSRGYGATATTFPYRVNANSTAEDCGDEPLLIFLRTGCPCVVAPARVEAVRALLEQADVDLILSDDGLQHYALGRHFEIAILDAQRGIGNGFLLPAGPLREPATRLAEVDKVLYRGGENSEHGVAYRLDALVNVVTGEHRDIAPDALQHTVFAVAGIGQPQQFFDGIVNAGFTVEPRVFADHHLYVAEDFFEMQGKPVLMTEKDAVKCRAFATDNFWYLKLQAQLPDALLHSIAALARNHQQESV